MRFFFRSCRRLYDFKTANHHITLYDAYIEIYKAIFAAVLYTLAEPTRILRGYHADKSWRTILNPNYTRLITGQIIVACIAAPCALLVAILFAAIFILMLPFQLVLFLIATFLGL